MRLLINFSGSRVWRRRRRARTRSPNSCFSARIASAGASSSRPFSIGATAMARESRLATNSGQPPQTGITAPLRRRISSSISRRPCDSASSRTRPAKPSSQRLKFSAGSSARASMRTDGAAAVGKLTWGPVWVVGSSSNRLTSIRACAFSKTRKSAAGQKTSAGCSSGRSASPRFSSYRSSMAAHASAAAAWGSSSAAINVDGGR